MKKANYDNGAYRSGENSLPDTIEGMIALWYKRVADTDMLRISFKMTSGDKLMKPYFEAVTLTFTGGNLMWNGDLTLANLQYAYRHLKQAEAEHEKE